MSLVIALNPVSSVPYATRLFSLVTEGKALISLLDPACGMFWAGPMVDLTSLSASQTAQGLLS